jgi:anti-anti-sigma factor
VNRDQFWLNQQHLAGRSMTLSSAFQLETVRHVTVVSLLPGLNEIPWSDIEQVGSQVLTHVGKSAQPSVLVDLCHLDYMGSAQVALVVRIFKAIKERGGKLIVSNRHPMVLEVLSLAGLNKLWTIVDSRAIGLKQLGVTESPVTSDGAASNADSSHFGFAVGSLLGLLVGLVGLGLAMTGVTGQPPLAIAGVAVTAAVVGFALGLTGILQSQGTARTISTLGLVGSTVLMLLGVFVAGSSLQSGLGSSNTPPTPSPAPTPAAAASSTPDSTASTPTPTVTAEPSAPANSAPAPTPTPVTAPETESQATGGNSSLATPAPAAPNPIAPTTPAPASPTEAAAPTPEP